MKNFFQDIVSIKTVAGMHIHLKAQDEYIVRICLLEKKKGKIYCKSLESYETGMEEELSGILPHGTAVVCTFTGFGVLNKEFSGDKEPENLSRYFPENKRDGLYCYTTHYQGGVGMSLCRKQQVGLILENEIWNAYPVLDLHIGPYIATVLWETGLIEEKEIPLSIGTLCQENLSLPAAFDANRKEDVPPLALGDDPIPSTHVLAYASALRFHLGMKQNGFVGLIPSVIHADYGYKELIAKSRFAILGLILAVLSINFLVFESYRKKESSIQEQLQMNNHILIQRDSLRAVLKAKEDFLSYLGENRTFYSIMLDEIAATVPHNIKLDDLQINPMIQKVQKDEPLEFEKKIRMKGTAKNTLLLNKWEQKLGSISWVNEVEVISFAQSKDKNAGEFVVEITLK